MSRPLKITAHLAGPVGNAPPMLDSLLESIMARLLSHDDLRRSPENFQPDCISIPLERQRVTGYPFGIPLCSAPIFAAATDGVEHYARRFDVEPSMIVERDRKVFHANSGELKSFRLPLRVRYADRIVWFASGNRKEIRSLLKRFGHSVGKKISQGFGRVARWEVEDTDTDAWWYSPSPEGTVLMRTLPNGSYLPKDLIGYRPWFGGAVPPYWMPDHFCEVVQPC